MDSHQWSVIPDQSCFTLWLFLYFDVLTLTWQTSHHNALVRVSKSRAGGSQTYLQLLGQSLSYWRLSIAQGEAHIWKDVRGGGGFISGIKARSLLRSFDKGVGRTGRNHTWLDGNVCNKATPFSCSEAHSLSPKGSHLSLEIRASRRERSQSGSKGSAANAL
jgi:hypothetical protein